MKIYTIKDIARLSGVSVTTVSRVLNHRPDVNAATRQKVEQVMSACHFVGNANARSLKQQDSDLVAVILRGRSNPFLTALAEAVLRHARPMPPAFLMEFIDEQADEFQAALRLSREKRVSGFLFLGSRIDERAQALDGLDVPLMFATVDASALPRASSVSIDDRKMARQAVETLLEAGHRRIAVFGGCREGGDSLALRYQGAMDAFHAANVPFDEDCFVETRFSMRGAYDCARAFFARRDDPTAVFAMSDTAAIGVIRALCDIGKRVPEDVSVFGFDGTEIGSCYVPRLSTVEQPVEEIARTSVETLTQMLLSGAPPRHVTLEARLLQRESTR